MIALTPTHPSPILAPDYEIEVDTLRYESERARSRYDKARSETDEARAEVYAIERRISATEAVYSSYVRGITVPRGPYLRSDLADLYRDLDSARRSLSAAISVERSIRSDYEYADDAYRVRVYRGL